MHVKRVFLQRQAREIALKIIQKKFAHSQYSVAIGPNLRRIVLSFTGFSIIINTV